MSKKKHHFVPQFYLRHFGVDSHRDISDRRQIGLFNWKSDLILSSVGIRDQCQRHKFYGKDDQLENALADMEGFFGTSLKRLVEGDGLFLELDDVETMLAFIATQWVRTEHAYEKIFQTYEAALDLASSGSRAGVTGVEEYRIEGREDEAKEIMITVALEALTGCLRCLYPTIVCTADGGPFFLTSDAPVVHYNQFLEGAPTGSGLGCYGAQVFLPLNPRQLLFLYDPHVYKVPQDKSGRTWIRRENDIDQLNLLQLLSSKQNVFFGPGVAPEYLRATHALSCDFRTDQEVLAKEYARRNEDGSVDESASILETQLWRPEIQLQLSFCHLKSKFKKIPMATRVSNKIRVAGRPSGPYKSSLPSGFYEPIRRAIVDNGESETNRYRHEAIVNADR